MLEEERNAGDPPARNNIEVSIRNRGYLPHIEITDSIYFITFRLADSLPQSIIEEYKQTKGNKQLRKIFSEKVEAILDSGNGNSWLSNPEISQIIEDTLRIHEDKKYILISYCIMPNHVHLLIKPINNHTLSEILHSLKSYTAKMANKRLNREGEFWQTEYYDHIIRNEKEYYNTINYIMQNPIRANLENKQKCWVNEEYLEKDL